MAVPSHSPPAPHKTNRVNMNHNSYPLEQTNSALQRFWHTYPAQCLSQPPCEAELQSPSENLEKQPVMIAQNPKAFYAVQGSTGTETHHPLGKQTT